MKLGGTVSILFAHQMHEVPRISSQYQPQLPRLSAIACSKEPSARLLRDLGFSATNGPLLFLPHRHLPLSHKIHTPLPIKRSLILQPPPIPAHTSNPLAIEVWHWVVRPRSLRIDPMLLYPLEKGSLFPLEPLRLSPIHDSPYLIAEYGAE